MKEKGCEFTNNVEAGLAQFQAWNQKNEKANFEISIKAEVALAKKQDWNQKYEKKGM
jgi:hypothetical protein